MNKNSINFCADLEFELQLCINRIKKIKMDGKHDLINDACRAALWEKLREFEHILQKSEDVSI